MIVSTLATSVLACVRDAWEGAASSVRVSDARGKGPRDVVTQMGVAVETRLRRDLPEIARADVLSEESVGNSPCPAPASDSWVVDPLDGTANFLDGWPHSVSVALWQDGHVRVGLVWVPGRDVAYMASAGAGAVESRGARLRVLAPFPPKVPLAIAGVARPSERAEEASGLMALAWDAFDEVRILGPSSLDACRVASGDASAYLSVGMEPWDWMAGALIALESGVEVMGDGRGGIAMAVPGKPAEALRGRFPLSWTGGAWEGGTSP